jgi:hypothetical protein
LDVIEVREFIEVLFDDGGVDKRFAMGDRGRFGHGPAGFRELGTLQYEHGGAQQDGGRGSGVIEDGQEGFEGAVAEQVKVVAAGEDEFGAGAMEGGGKLFMGFHPAIYGNAVDVAGFGGGGNGGAGGEGVNNALLDGSERRIESGICHLDDEDSMRVSGSWDISEAVCFVFKGMAGM